MGEGDAGKEAKSGNEKDKPGEPGAFMQRRKHTQVLHDTRRVLMSLVEQRRSGVGGIMRGRPRLCPSARAAPLRGRGEGQLTTRGPISRAAGCREKCTTTARVSGRAAASMPRSRGHHVPGS